MKDAPLFSVVVIARNEEKTLPRLVASLKEFQDRGGQIVVLDTGSTDNTAFVAYDSGCKLYSVVDGFRQTLDAETAEKINQHFVVGTEPEIVKAGNSCFDYAAARNYAAGLANCDVIAMPDCDEIYTRLDIDAINEAIRSGAQQFEYDFVFSHDAEGKALVQFMHCKFYDRRKLKWEGIIHEVLINTGIGEPNRKYFPPEVIKLEHWQNPETKRGHYLIGLAIDCYRNPNNDRNSHYFARELMWSGRTQSAIQEFGRHVRMNRWAAERAQSMIFIGDCLAQQEAHAGALYRWAEAIITDGSRRAGFLRIANHFYRLGDAQNTRTWATAALQIPLNSYYGNEMTEYRELPHELLYWAFWRLGDKLQSEQHWKKCFEYQPHSDKYLHDARFYMALPRVGIIIPHIYNTREKELARCADLIHANANYPNYEVVVSMDTLKNRQGVAKTFNLAVEQNTSGCDLIMFLGDDCEPQPNFLIEAVLEYYRAGAANLLLNWEALDFSSLDAGLVALNDGVWNGKLATHWLAGHKFLSCLPDKKFLCEAYHHVGCDNELTARAKKLGRYSYCEHSKIKHTQIQDEVHELAWAEDRVAEDRRILKWRGEQYEFGEFDNV